MGTGSKTLSRWYREMAQQIAAGYTLPQALTGAGGPPVPERERMSQALLQGQPLDEILRAAPRWLPREDRYLISSFAHTGRLVEGMRLLAERHAMRAEQARQAWSAVPYPLAVIHFAILALPLRYLLFDGIDVYLSKVGIFLVPLWAVIGLIVWGAVNKHRWLGLIAGVMPWIRSYRNHRAVADLAFTLESFLLAGEAVDLSWEGAGLASGRKRLGKAAIRIAKGARQGVPPGDLLPKERVFPEDFVSLYRVGERTGQLDTNLNHLAVIYRERASDKLKAASFWYPKFLFACVAVGIGYIIVSFYIGYFRQIEEMLQF